MSDYSGNQKIEFCKRLDDWESLADYLDLSTSDLDDIRATPGQKNRALWEWLDRRQKLADLPAALRAMNREDLAAILEQPVPGEPSKAPVDSSPSKSSPVCPEGGLGVRDPSYEFDVFLSHSSKDKQVVTEVAELLRADGFRVWFDEWEIKYGQSIPQRVEEGLDASRVLALFMSENAYKSDWARLEQQSMTFEDPQNNKRHLIPVRLDDSPLRTTLKTFKYIDARSGGSSWQKELAYALREIVSGPDEKDPPDDGEQSYEDWLQVAADLLASHISGMATETAAKVKRSIGIDSEIKNADLPRTILEILLKVAPEKPEGVSWFDRVIVKLERIEKELGVSSEDGIRVQKMLNVVFQIGFPRSVLVELAKGLRPGTAVASRRTVATHVLAELATAYAGKVEPQFIPSDLVLRDGRKLQVRGFGQLNYTDASLGDPEEIVPELLKDLAGQVSVTLKPESSIEERAEECRRAFELFANRRAEMSDEQDSNPCRFYWVVVPPKGVNERKRLEETLSKVGSLIPQLAIFLVETFADTKKTEEVILQILKDRFVERKRR